MEVIARPDIVQKDSAMACGFIRAAMHAWEYSVDHDEEAVAALAEAFPNAAQGATQCCAELALVWRLLTHADLRLRLL